MELPAALEHRAFVQRCKAYAVEPAGESLFDHRLQRVACELSRLWRCFAALEACRIDIAEIDDREIVTRETDLVHARVTRVRKRNACIPYAEVEHARIAEYDEVRFVLRRARCKHFRRNLGPDAGHVAEHDADGG